ncbi:hypothetical protein CSB69_2555 [Morganella morganii]|nr:hypothetical protein CSB69_2555 [Morganella morganii]
MLLRFVTLSAIRKHSFDAYSFSARFLTLINYKVSNSL